MTRKLDAPTELITQLKTRFDSIAVYHKLDNNAVHDFAPVIDLMLDIAGWHGATYISIEDNALICFEGLRVDGWPLAWKLVKCFGFDGGAGNSNAMQLWWPRFSNGGEKPYLGVYHVPTKERIAPPSPHGWANLVLRKLDKKVVLPFDWDDYR